MHLRMAIPLVLLALVPLTVALPYQTKNGYVRCKDGSAPLQEDAHGPVSCSDQTNCPASHQCFIQHGTAGVCCPAKGGQYVGGSGPDSGPPPVLPNDEASGSETDLGSGDAGSGIVPVDPLDLPQPSGTDSGDGPILPPAVGDSNATDPIPNGGISEQPMGEPGHDSNSTLEETSSTPIIVVDPTFNPEQPGNQGNETSEPLTPPPMVPENGSPGSPGPAPSTPSEPLSPHRPPHNNETPIPLPPLSPEVTTGPILGPLPPVLPDITAGPIAPSDGNETSGPTIVPGLIDPIPGNETSNPLPPLQEVTTGPIEPVPGNENETSSSLPPLVPEVTGGPIEPIPGGNESVSMPPIDPVPPMVPEVTGGPVEPIEPIPGGNESVSMPPIDPVPPMVPEVTGGPVEPLEPVSGGNESSTSMPPLVPEVSMGPIEPIPGSETSSPILPIIPEVTSGPSAGNETLTPVSPHAPYVTGPIEPSPGNEGSSPIPPVVPGEVTPVNESSSASPILPGEETTPGPVLPPTGGNSGGGSYINGTGGSNGSGIYSWASMFNMMTPLKQIPDATTFRKSSGPAAATSGQFVPCKKNSDCFDLREPDEWCLRGKLFTWTDKSCFCAADTEIQSCIIERFDFASGQIQWTFCTPDTQFDCDTLRRRRSSQVKV